MRRVSHVVKALIIVVACADVGLCFGEEAATQNGADAERFIVHSIPWATALPAELLTRAALPSHLGRWVVAPLRATNTPSLSCCEVLIPIVSGELEPTALRALVASLRLHNTQHYLRVTLASDPTTLAEALDALSEGALHLHAPGASTLELRALSLTYLSHAAPLTLLASELLPDEFSLVVLLEQSCVVLDELGSLWDSAPASSAAVHSTYTSLFAMPPGAVLVNLMRLRALTGTDAVEHGRRRAHAITRRVLEGGDGGGATSQTREELSAWFFGQLRGWRAPGGASMWALLPCTWSYASLSHVHRLALDRSNEVPYVLCESELAHQAFLPLHRRRLAEAYGPPSALACGCGERARILSHGADGEGGGSDGGGLLSALQQRWASTAISVGTTGPGAAAITQALLQYAERDMSASSRAHVVLFNGSMLAVVPHQPPRLPALPLPSCPGGVTPVVFPCHAASVENHWLTRVLLAGCTGGVREICFEALVEAHRTADGASGHRGPSRLMDELLCERTVLVLQDAQYELATMMIRAAGYSTAHLAFVHISHSLMYQDEAPRAVERYAEWRVAFRNNEFADSYNSDADADATRDAGAGGMGLGWPSALREARRRRAVHWYPLGVSAQWLRLGLRDEEGELPSVAASARSHFLSFLGSTDKSDREQRVASVRAALVEAAGEGVQMLSTHGRHACYDDACNNTDYVDAMRGSALSLHLPGSNSESGRLWEAVEAGSIPVVVESFGPGEEAVGTKCLYGTAAVRATRDALLPLIEDLGGLPLPFVVVPDLEALVPALRRLRADPVTLDEQQAQTRAWWRTVKRFYGQRFQDLVCAAEPGG